MAAPRARATTAPAPRARPAKAPAPRARATTAPAPAPPPAVAAVPAPTLRTARLVLRAPRADDAPALARAGADPRVARYLVAMPRPFDRAAAAAWIARATRDWAGGAAAAFVLELDGAVIGTCALRRGAEPARAELTYWLGTPWWGRKLAREAVAAVVRWGFDALSLHRVFGQYLGDNHASGRVMQAAGMRPEGVRRGHVRKGRRWYDAHQFGLLRSDLPGAGRRRGRRPRRRR